MLMTARSAGIQIRKWSFVALAILPVSASAELLHYTTGSSVHTWNPDTGHITEVSTYTERLGAIVFDSSGVMFAVAPVSGGIVRLDTSGSWSQVVNGLNQPNRLAEYGPGRVLYASQLSSGVITRIDQSGGVSDWVTLPEMITGLLCDIDGSIFATGGKKVFRVAPDGSYSTFADLSNAIDSSYIVSGITRAADGTLYVARQGQIGLVYSLTRQGELQLVGGHPDRLYYAFQVAANELNQISVLHIWSPFVGYSQLTSLTNGRTIGYSGFEASGIAFASAAVPEPGSLPLFAIGAAVIAVAVRGTRRKVFRKITS